MSDKQTKLLDAANKLLAEKGYHGFSMKELAQTAQIAAGTIYLYFKNKQDLIQSLHQRNLRTLAQCMFDGLDETMPIYDQFSCIWKNFWKYSLEHPEAILAKDQFDHLPEILQASEEALAKELFQKVGEVLHKGVQQGVFQNLPIDILATLSIEPCANLARKHIIGSINIQDESLEQLILACWNAIAVQEGTIQ